MSSRKSTPDLFRGILTAVLCLAFLARISARFWHLPLPPSGLDLVVVVLCCTRVLFPLAKILRGRLPWQRGIVPTLIWFSVISMFEGSQSRFIAKVAAAAVEVMIIIAVLYMAKMRESDRRPAEERILDRIELFFPPLAARLITGEFVILRSAALAALGRFRTLPDGFGYVENSFMPVLPWLVLLAAPADLLLFHVLLPFGNAAWTYVVSFLDIWVVAWMYGIVVTMRLRPHQVVGGRLLVFKGILGRADIDVSKVRFIASVDDARRYRKDSVRGTDLSVIGATKLDVQLTDPVEVEVWFYGLHRMSSRIRISADNAGALRAAVESAQRERAQSGIGTLYSAPVGSQ